MIFTLEILSSFSFLFCKFLKVKQINIFKEPEVPKKVVAEKKIPVPKIPEPKVVPKEPEPVAAHEEPEPPLEKGKSQR